MNIVFEGFVQYKCEMRTFSTEAISISATIIMLANCLAKQPFRFLDLRTNFRQIAQTQGCAVLFDEFHQRHIIKIQIAINHLKTFLRKVVGLVNKVDVFVSHDAYKNIFFYSSNPVIGF